MSDGGPAAGAVDAFETHRPSLLGVAYRIIGSRTDAEDVLQEAWLRWQAVDRSGVDEPRGFLFRLVTNAAIDALRRSRVRREEYVGPWLPEPIPFDPPAAEGLERADSLSMGVLLLLESLPPIERAVFVLHEAFGFSYEEIAGVVGRTEHAVRQLAYRARRHLEGGRQRFIVSPALHQATVRRFMDAATGGDLPALLDLLAPSVTFWADANGLSEMPREPLHGSTELACYLVSVAEFWPADRQVLWMSINGAPGVLVTSAGAPFMALTFDIGDDGRIATVYAVRNLGKLLALIPGPGTSLI